MACPRYLSDQAELWSQDPHAANLAWFREARFGLFIHYGLYSQLGRGEWTLFRDQLPVREYERLAASFDPKHFDADRITDLACEAGMRYVNLTTCHHEGFCLYDSAVEPFNSVQARGRDLVAEVAEHCDRKGLGFFAYFTHAINWRHPSACLDGPAWNRPDHDTGTTGWLPFWDWSQACIRELCQLPQPVAGIWLDLIMAYYAQPELMPIEQTYELIRHERPEALISFKQGATGSEDFAAPEFHFASRGKRLRDKGDERGAAIAERAWEVNRHKHNEICMCLQTQGWGWDMRARHKSADEILAALGYAGHHDCNLLANVGPLPDGSIHPDDVACLKQVGRRIRDEGWPEPQASAEPAETSGAAGA